MPARSLLTCRDPDGQVFFEVLASGSAFAELVDPDDATIIHSGPFAMNGREWKIDKVTVSQDIVRIECVPLTAPMHESPSQRTRT